MSLNKLKRVYINRNNLTWAKDLTKKNSFFFFERSWFKSNNLGPLLGIALKVYSSVAKELKLKFRKN